PEERGGGAVQIQYVWSPVYIDALVLRDRDANGLGADGLEERLWVQQDADFNVTALLDSAGNVVERYAYDPYGAFSVLAADFSARGSRRYSWGFPTPGLR